MLGGSVSARECPSPTDLPVRFQQTSVACGLCSGFWVPPTDLSPTDATGVAEITVTMVSDNDPPFLWR